MLFEQTGEGACESSDEGEESRTAEERKKRCWCCETQLQRTVGPKGSGKISKVQAVLFCVVFFLSTELAGHKPKDATVLR